MNGAGDMSPLLFWTVAPIGLALLVTLYLLGVVLPAIRTTDTEEN